MTTTNVRLAVIETEVKNIKKLLYAVIVVVAGSTGLQQLI